MRFRFLIVILIMPVSLLAQLTAPGSEAVRYTSYPSAPGIKDPVFIFCNESGTRQGNLNAVSLGGTGPYSFNWYRWSDVTKSFSVFLKSESDLMSSSANNLDEGGYRVNISDGVYTTSLTGWIFLDKPYSSASLQNRTCDYVALSGMAATDTFYYKDPSGGNLVKLPNKVKFLWSSNPASSIPYPDLNINPQTFNPPLEDVTYQLQVSDSFGCISQSSFLYQSIHVKADFTPDPVKGEAPLIVAFENKSIRGSSFKWEFGDNTPDSELETPDDHTYFIPGSYSVKLTIESDLHCINSIRYDSIVVEHSSLSIPNVFTPDDDGYNDRFMVEAKSLRFISVEVFSQSGMKVYGFSGEGDRLKSWTGWDGKINNTSGNASPGVYFYIIRALGWDNIRYDTKAYRGFLYLYR